MADTYDPAIRSYVMSRIKKKDTKPEITVRQFLFKNGFRFRIHAKELIGNPDIVLPKYKKIIFVNGCFWHAHEGCKLNRMPKSRPDYWIPKITRTIERDKRNRIELERFGWEVIVIWECQLKSGPYVDTLNSLLKSIQR